MTTTSHEDNLTEIMLALDLEAKNAGADLLPEMYDDLRDLARRYMRRQAPGQTLDSTGLVHEAYLKLNGNTEKRFKNKGHFYAAAALAMRHILVDRARKRQALRYGAGRARIELQDQHGADEEMANIEEILGLDEALSRFKEVNRRAWSVVMLRYFAGLSIEQAAQLLDCSTATIKRDWQFARAWLFDAVNGTSDRNNG